MTVEVKEKWLDRQIRDLKILGIWSGWIPLAVSAKDRKMYH